MSDPCAIPRTGQIRHELKTWSRPFRAVVSGDKRYEIRKNDRCFHVGDELMLKEYDPATGHYSGSECLVRVTYITEGGNFGLPLDMCVMSIQVQHWAMPNEPALSDT